MRAIYVVPAIALAFLLGPPAEAYNYGEALQKSIYFYTQQRCGDLPADNPVIWRADSCLNDGADVGLDLTGGWFDAGDHVKYGLAGAATVTTMAWAVHEYRSAFQGAGLLDEMLDAIKWETDYFLKCHTAPNEFYYQVGDTGSDHGWWGPAEVIEEVMDRPSAKATISSPASTVVAATAAALAATSLVFEPADPTYASTCLTHAEQLFDFAYATQSDRGYNTGGPYKGSGNFWDEFSAAAAWLYIATSDSAYLTTAEACTADWPTEGHGPSTTWAYKWTHCWDDMHYMAQILLARITGSQSYVDSIDRSFAYWIPAYADAYGSQIPEYDGTSIAYSPGGEAWLDQWGSLRYAVHEGFMAYVWADFIADATKKGILGAFADSQMDYCLGSNPRGSSYLIGFGVNPPVNPHHRTGHGPWYNDIDDPPDNAHNLYGALVGGPNAADDQYVDSRYDYVENEVCITYNMGMLGLLAKMHSLYGGNPIANFPTESDFKPPEERRLEYFVRAAVQSESDTRTSITSKTANRSCWPATVKDNLSFRYFFDLTETYDAGYTVEDITVTNNTRYDGTISGPFLYSGRVYYVILDFAGTKIFPGGRNECEKRAEFALEAPTGAAWDPTNDWSRQGLTGSINLNPTDMSGLTAHIPIYEGGVLLWGEEPTSDTTPPAAPTNLTATAAGSSQIDLDWDDNSEPDLHSYNVYRSTNSGGPYDQVASGVTQSAHSDTGLSASTTYYYVVTAVDTSSNESAESNEASATTSEGGGEGSCHVASITVTIVPVAGPRSKARAEVVILDDQGAPVENATVTGTFTGDISDSGSDDTDANGLAVIESKAAKDVASVTFCVDSVTHATLTYEPGDNAETCDSN
jgi:endoglucanase